MCGIIGYVGLDDAKKELLKGLQALEYRGYDSAPAGQHMVAYRIQTPILTLPEKLL